VLDYLLKRDADGDGLVEMLTESCHQARGSDWIDVVWASHENALVNAQLYLALTLWAECEATLSDSSQAESYRNAARKLKQQFNKPTDQGGFWDPQAQCYVYWRDKDESIHGTNLVVPVNFSAIGYGLCDDANRRNMLLDRIEALMQREKLFFWPLCFFSYASEEAHPSQFPFPNYENGDLFLAWGELGTRAYAAQNPAVAVKYVKNVLDRYAQDGLAFQRYSRKSQTGTGNDILANNCSTLVGLYRNIYGVQPKHDRLWLEPHLTPELSGTQIRYVLRAQSYDLEIREESCRGCVEGFAVRGKAPFGMRADANKLHYFSNASQPWALSVTRPTRAPLEIQIECWSDAPLGQRRWIQMGGRGGVRYEVASLAPGRRYRLLRGGDNTAWVVPNASGIVEFMCEPERSSPVKFELVPE
jgi:hypothetical protein